MIKHLVIAIAALGLSACKVELHTGLSETESNDMVALLLSHNLDAVKGSATKEGVPLLVESADEEAFCLVDKTRGESDNNDLH